MNQGPVHNLTSILSQPGEQKQTNLSQKNNLQTPRTLHPDFPMDIPSVEAKTYPLNVTHQTLVLQQPTHSQPPFVLPQWTSSAQPVPSPVRTNEPLSKRTIILLILVFLLIAGGGTVAVLFLKNSRTPPVQQPVVSVQSISPTRAPTVPMPPSPTTAPPPPFPLLLNAQPFGILTPDKQIVLSGKTKPGIPVLLIGQLNDIGVSSAQDGGFNGTIVLNKGINPIFIIAVDQQGNTKQVTTTIISDDTASSTAQLTVGRIAALQGNMIQLIDPITFSQRSINVTNKTVFITNDKVAPTLSSLKVGDTIAADVTSSTDVKRVFVLLQDTARSVRVGRISALSPKFTIQANGENQSYDFAVTSKTSIQTLQNKTTTLQSFQTGQEVAAIGKLQELQLTPDVLYSLSPDSSSLTDSIGEKK